jgi:hypothetical protein
MHKYFGPFNENNIDNGDDDETQFINVCSLVRQAILGEEREGDWGGGGRRACLKSFV